MTTDVNEGAGTTLVHDWDAARMVCKLLSYLLQYPDAEWRAGLQGFREAAGSLTDGEAQKVLTAFSRRAEEADPIRWQDEYVRTFDFDKKSNLYLTYAVYGDERDRGPALIELKRRYEAAGFYMEGSELPDYLPMVLEFAAEASEEEALGVISVYRKALTAMAESLSRLTTPYAPLLELLLRVLPEADNDAAVEASADVGSQNGLWTGGVKR